jgi:hypothetical protein
MAELAQPTSEQHLLQQTGNRMLLDMRNAAALHFHIVFISADCLLVTSINYALQE